MAHEIVTKEEAIKQGRKTYFTGEPCPNGHIDLINVKGRCVVCAREGSRNAKRKKAAGKATGKAVARVNNNWRPYATKIITAWQKTTASIIETGQCLIQAKAELEHGSFEAMVQRELPFDRTTAFRLMAIAKHPVLSKVAHVQHLPNSWGTLYELTKIPDTTLREKIKDHTINPRMQRKDVALITGKRDPKTKLKRRSKADERIIEQAEEINSLKAYVAELEAARDADRPDAFPAFLDTDDETLGDRLIVALGRERAAVIAAIMQRKLGNGASSEAA